MLRYFCLILIFSNVCHAKQVEWIVLDFPPYYFVASQLNGNGRDESVIQLLKQHDPEFIHTSTIMPASRAVYALNDTSTLRCIVSLYQTEQRKSFISFSTRYSTIGLPITVAIRKKTLIDLNIDASNSISLEKILRDESMHVGYTQNRSFGPEIDAVLAKAHQEQLEARSGTDVLNGLTKMLLKDRLELVLGYASEHYYTKNVLDADDTLTQLSLSESPNLSMGYIGCSKHTDAEEFLAISDATLQRLHSQAPYHKVMLHWLPEELKSRLRPSLEY
ncbi:hypothetical protein PALB_30700 [Pseudoalteromonas luteoviolacea B = ATCC 29581]|nr:hypothetical protein PALB_30700 [Pseudoalteromonas luteoviolacea B = ATCC 29581]